MTELWIFPARYPDHCLRDLLVTRYRRHANLPCLPEQSSPGKYLHLLFSSLCNLLPRIIIPRK